MTDSGPLCGDGSVPCMTSGHTARNGESHDEESTSSACGFAEAMFPEKQEEYHGPCSQGNRDHSTSEERSESDREALWHNSHERHWYSRSHHLPVPRLGSYFVGHRRSP